jgi:hypothetical protein
MKYNFLIFYISILLFNCSNSNKDEDLVLFESFLGEENTALIDTLLIDFQTSIFKYYSNNSKEEAYKKFLIDIKNNSINEKEWNLIVSEENWAKFKSSGLYNDIYKTTDSVWVEKDSTKIEFYRNGNPLSKRLIYLNTNGEIEYDYTYSTLDPLNINLDSLIIKEYKIVEYNELGKYHKALGSLIGKSDFISSLYDIKDNFGIQPANLIAEVLLNNDNFEFKNNLDRRIIMLELAY